MRGVKNGLSKGRETNYKQRRMNGKYYVQRWSEKFLKAKTREKNV